MIGTWLLAMESLILTLLWVATGMAWRARKPGTGRSFVVGIMIFLPLVVYGALCAAYLESSSRVRLSPEIPYVLTLLLGGYVLGVCVLWYKGRRVVHREPPAEATSSEPTSRAASLWPAGKLAFATLLGLLLHAMTFWNLDTSMQHRLEALRVEAGARALAVAPGKPADRENAALVYEQAFALLPAKYEDWPKPFFSEWIDERYIVKHPQIYEDHALLKFLESQRSVIELLHQAAQLPACSFDHNYAEPSIAMLIPEVGSMRDAARILTLAARAEAAQGNLRSAAEHAQTLLMMAEHTAADPLLISMLVSFALDQMAVDTLQSILSGEQPTLSELASLDFGPPQATTRRLNRAFKMEEAFGLAAFGQLATQRNMWGFIDDVGHANADLAWLYPPALAMYRVLLLEDDVAVYREQFHKFQELAPLSPAAARAKVGAIQYTLAFHRRGYLASVLVPALESSFLAAGRHAARLETVQAGIAVHRYRAEQGKLPTGLAALVPKYLVAVPLDPYDDQPLKWKVAGEDWVVYSIGEDLKDEGGALYNDRDRTGDIGFYSVLPSLPVEQPAEEEQGEQSQPEKLPEEFKIPAEPAKDEHDPPAGQEE